MGAQWRELYELVVVDHSIQQKFGASFKPWFDQLIASDVHIGTSARSKGYEVKTALQKIYQLDKTSTDELLINVLTTCYQAAINKIPDRSRRQKESEIEREFPSQKKALTKITQFMKRYPEACSWALAQAYLAWRKNHPGYGIQFITGNENPFWATVCEDLLTCYATELNNGVLSVKKRQLDASMENWSSLISFPTRPTKCPTQCSS